MSDPLEALRAFIVTVVRDELKYQPVVPSQEEPRYLSSAQVCERTGYSPITLKKYRLAGKGPPFTKPHGRVMYRTDEVDAWLAAAQRGKPRPRRAP